MRDAGIARFVGLLASMESHLRFSITNPLRTFAQGRENECHFTTQYIGCSPAKIETSRHQTEKLLLADMCDLAIRNARGSKAVGFPNECRWEPEY
jgi:hypothetical protein